MTQEMPTIQQVMLRDVLAIDPEQSTLKALELMAERRVGSIVVTKGLKPLGIFTERDLLYKVVLANKDPQNTPVRDVMTRKLVSVTTECTIETAYTKMSKGNFRHLLVLGNKGDLRGIISIKDLTKIREQILEIEVDRKTRQIFEVTNRLADSLSLLEKEMTFAGNFQKQLVETRQPTFKNLRISHIYKQAASLGGDYFGVARIDQDHAGILMVDVMGHGITSAMIAVEIKMYYDMLSRRILFPGVLITEMNRIISDLMPPGFFVAGCYAVLNLKTLHIRYTHFGLPRPGILRAGANKYERMPPLQVPLGINPGTEYPEKDVFLRPGDKLLLFTDGCIEQKNSKGKVLGSDRFTAYFRQCVSKKSSNVVKDLYKFVLSYCGNDKLSDDLAILLVEFK